MKSNYLFLALIILFISGCTSENERDGAGVITYANIERHIVELSDDKHRGRMPMSENEQAVIEYIASQMQEIGLEGANNGSFFQKVPIMKVSSTLSETLDFLTPGGKLSFGKLTDYVAFSRKVSNELILDKSDVIFAGFGIVAPEYGRNDFVGLDLNGKTVIVFVNDPGYGTGSEYFKGNEMTYYGRWTYKFEEAARRGAKACFIVHETGPAGYPWEVVANNGETTKLYPESENGYNDRCDFEGWISLTAAHKLFEACGLSFDEVKKISVSPEFKPFELPVTVSGWMINKYETGISNNVCGIIRGSVKPDEVLIYTAHWDHLGVGTPVNGDSIYNGATDNASAVAWMLEIARAFTSGSAPQRSVLFLSPTAEESGLIGAEFYAENPFFLMENTVGVINTDVILFFGEFRDITLTGYGYSDMDEIVSAEALKVGRYIAADPNPENGMFFRSDHFPFVKKGVPAIFAKGYTEAIKYGKGQTLELIEEYWNTVYHTPQDEYLPDRDDLSGLVSDAILFYRIGLHLTKQDIWPDWKESSEFQRNHTLKK
jgi:Zn-dependent M28 family amino/carboxypeptidase